MRIGQEKGGPYIPLGEGCPTNNHRDTKSLNLCQLSFDILSELFLVTSLPIEAAFRLKYWS
jgi:hypothetical protein